jgi:saccharopepsin
LVFPKSTVDLHAVGIYGILGLGFNDPSLSPINGAVQSIYGSEQSWAASVLANIFHQQPSKPNIVALELQRTVDLEDTEGGSFTIGEIDQDSAAVLNAPKLNQYPPGEGRWTTLMDGMRVDGKSVVLESPSKGVPSGSVITLLDTGNPSLTITKSMRDAIYSSIPGAAFDSASKVWVVPCNVTTIVEFGFRYIGDRSIVVSRLIDS